MANFLQINRVVQEYCHIIFKAKIIFCGFPCLFILLQGIQLNFKNKNNSTHRKIIQVVIIYKKIEKKKGILVFNFIR